MESKLQGITKIEEILSRGADERIFLNEEGLTKYGTPLIRDNYVNRGSCTCSAARESDVQLMNDLLEQNTTKEDWIQYKNELNDQLKQELGWDEAHDFKLFLAPSGTDLVYYPLIFAQLLEPGKTVNNLITCIEELGSGTKSSSVGEFYADYNQFGNKTEKGVAILPHQNVNTVYFNARSRDGKIQKNSESIRALVDQHPDELVIVNLVYGSKSGIEDDLKLIDEIKADNLQWVVDICQFRHSRDILHQLISKGAMVMITGSKFYESAPFSGAMLVPKSIYDKLLKVNDWSSVEGYSAIFSKYDVPAPLMERNSFTDEINIPGLLRWASALKSMRSFNKLKEKDTIAKTVLWRDKIYSLLNVSESFELMPHQELTNNSIVSFRVIKNGNYLSADQLKELYYSIVKGYYGADYPFDHITIGQPVTYGEKAFLRLAIGAKTTQQMVEEDQKEFVTDTMIVGIIETKLAELEIHNA